MSAEAIPPMTDPLGRHWRQPSAERIEVDATHALMDEATFKELPEYSGTIPSGVYDGKMWRRHDGIFANAIRDGSRPVRPEDCPWLLCWYGPAPDPGKCAINSRLIIIA